MATDNYENTSVCSRISHFNSHVEQHQKWQRINPFSHHNVRDMPRPNFEKEHYGTPPTGSQSEQRALDAQVQTLQEILQLCELINRVGYRIAWEDTMHKSVKFGALFEMYMQISDKLLGTLLCARRHKYIDFVGETLFQGRDDDEPVRLMQPYHELRPEILHKIETLRSKERSLEQRVSTVPPAVPATL